MSVYKQLVYWQLQTTTDTLTKKGKHSVFPVPRILNSIIAPQMFIVDTIGFGLEALTTTINTKQKQKTLYLPHPEALPSRKIGLILHTSRINPIIVTFLFSNKYTHISEVTLAFSLGLRYLCP